jgi:hypothetical protein
VVVVEGVEARMHELVSLDQLFVKHHVDGVQQPFPVVTNSDSCALDYLGVTTTSIHLCGRWVWWWCCESKAKEASSKVEGLRFVRYNFILLNSVTRWRETIVGTLPVTAPLHA